MLDDKIECCRTRKCGWKGLQRDLIPKPSTKHAFRGISANDMCCPKCGGKNYYIVERAATGDSHG